MLLKKSQTVQFQGTSDDPPNDAEPPAAGDVCGADVGFDDAVGAGFAEAVGTGAADADG